MKFARSLLRFFIFSNLFISLCSAAYTAKTSLILYHNLGSPAVFLLVFSATLLFYCFHRVNKRKFLTQNESSQARNSWMQTHKTTFYILITASALTLTFTLFFMPLRSYILFIPLALLGIGYTFPIIPTHNGPKRLRDISWLKTFWIAFAFSWLTSLLPVAFSRPLNSLITPPVLFIFFRALLFIFAICIPFDIRDIPFDNLKNVRTIPVITGPKTAVYIAITLMLLFISLICIQFLYFNLDVRQASALFLSAIITIILLLFAQKPRPPLFYPILFDGSMLLQAIVLFLFLRA